MRICGLCGKFAAGVRGDGLLGKSVVACGDCDLDLGLGGDMGDLSGVKTESIFCKLETNVIL